MIRLNNIKICNLNAFSNFKMKWNDKNNQIIQKRGPQQRSTTKQKHNQKSKYEFNLFRMMMT